MAEGTVESIYVSPGAGDPMASQDEVRAVAGKGLKGDYRFESPEAVDLTLIEAEAIESLEESVGLKLSPGEARRNVVTRGISLNELVGQELEVGSVRLRALRLSEPCQYLADQTDQRVLKGLLHKGGLKCEILNDGVIRVGDRVSAGVPVKS